MEGIWLSTNRPPDDVAVFPATGDSFVALTDDGNLKKVGQKDLGPDSDD